VPEQPSCTYAVTSSASWLTATGGTTVTYTALSNPHPAARSATLTITSAPSGFATVTVTEAGDAESLPFRQVRALYESVLGRDPDSGGFAFWTGAGAAGLGQMLDSFLTSPEAFNNDFAVMAAYQAATGAPPSYNQYLPAVNAVRAGTQTIGGLFGSLIAGNASFAAGTLYQNLLNRPAMPAEASNCTNLTACFQTLIGYPAAGTPYAAANNEFQSTGSFSHLADHTNPLYITLLYDVILGRDPDEGGDDFWLGVANGGGPGILFQGWNGFATRLQILGPGTPGQGFAGSPEFQGLYQ